MMLIKDRHKAHVKEDTHNLILQEVKINLDLKHLFQLELWNGLTNGSRSKDFHQRHNDQLQSAEYSGQRMTMIR
jgi:hypothetical protein